MGEQHYFSSSPAAASDPRRLTIRLPDLELEVTSDAGVFSGGDLDRGTRVLLEHAPLPPEGVPGDLLDLGCGYGPIALTLARRSSRTVHAVDVNERALALTATNAAALGLTHVRAVRPEELDPGVRFAGIYSNPPIRIGKPALHALLAEWLPRLLPGGHAYLVVAKHLGADSLARWLSDQGYAVERTHSHKGFRLLAVGRKS